jgi:hypothetical protein
VEQKRRCTTEYQREQGRKLAAVIQTRKEPVIKLIPTENGIASTWEVKDDLERVSIQENQSLFSQTSATPPMQSWILKLLGYAAEKPAVQHILDGSF